MLLLSAMLSVIFLWVCESVECGLGGRRREEEEEKKGEKREVEILLRRRRSMRRIWRR